MFKIIEIDVSKRTDDKFNKCWLGVMERQNQLFQQMLKNWEFCVINHINNSRVTGIEVFS